MSDRIGDKTDELEGKIEEVAGQAAGNEHWVAEGKRRQVAAHDPDPHPPSWPATAPVRRRPEPS